LVYPAPIATALPPAATASDYRARDARFLAWDDPWPTADVLAKLADAAEHLLDVHGCDAHGYEEIGITVRAAKDRLRALGLPRASPAPAPLSVVAAALCMPPEELARDGLAMLVQAGPAAYLRLLHRQDPMAWRARMMAILGATGGNVTQAADRIGITYRGLLKAIQGDAELQRQVSERWPERHERGLVR
jgi:hypothetical protein